MDKTFASLSKGNPGALNFLIELSTSPEVPVRTVASIQSSGIEGWGLYVLWSDLCEYDLKKVIKLVDECPMAVLKDACGRQDYSGRELVAQYLSEEEKK